MGAQNFISVSKFSAPNFALPDENFPTKTFFDIFPTAQNLEERRHPMPLLSDAVLADRRRRVWAAGMSIRSRWSST